jgi:endogenous inhibitor of DNA gyrase (YacG/DUF329 family)
MPKCPICDAAVKPRAENPSFPFCTSRCKMIDLGKWVNEEYRIPVEGDELEDDPNGGASGTPDAGASDGGSKTNKDMRH